MAVSPAPYVNVGISPDGHRAAVEIDGANSNTWILDLDRTALTRLTYQWSNSGVWWAPDGRRVMFHSGRGSAHTLFWQTLDGQGGVQPVFPLGQVGGPIAFASWSPDGRTVVFDALAPRTGLNIWSVRLDGDKVPKPFIQTAFNEGRPISPDGQWLAYQSDETGSMDVYMQRYPGPGNKVRVSTDGGRNAVWARNGRELFYRNGSAMMAVRIDPASGSVSRPQLLFRRAAPIGNFDVSPDGRFLMIDGVPEENSSQPITVLLNWPAVLGAHEKR